MNHKEYVVLDHGTGAKLSQELISLIATALGDVYIGKLEDSAVLSIGRKQIAITTDSFVVTPTFFGNGDIGKIAVCGTVNDLAVMGATPKYLTLAMIIEVSFSITNLLRIIESIRLTAIEANIKIVAGDTKIVAKGEADKIFINTTGIGEFERHPLSMERVRMGDKIILSGQLGNHSIHLLSIREGLGFETRVLSDCAPLSNMITTLLNSSFGNAIHSMRDVTRGGFAAVMQEYSTALGKEIHFFSENLPIQKETAMAADMLGIDPLHLANEGCLCLFVDPSMAESVVELLKENEFGKHAAIVGQVAVSGQAKVVMIKPDGTWETIEQLEGAVLPRLC